jgi:hypothetical protein
VYGIFCGGYHYSLKMYTYERVRARNFARTWGFVQCSQALPIAFGVPITGKFHTQSRIPVNLRWKALKVAKTNVFIVSSKLIPKLMAEFHDLVMFG